MLVNIKIYIETEVWEKTEALDVLLETVIALLIFQDRDDNIFLMFEIFICSTLFQV